MGRGQAEIIGTSEARAKLPRLVREVSSHDSPAESLRERAVEIRTRGTQRSALLVAEIDVDALEARVEELEEELENAGIALYVQERLGDRAAPRIDAATFLSGIGMEEFIGELPKRD